MVLTGAPLCADGNGPPDVNSLFHRFDYHAGTTLEAGKRGVLTASCNGLGPVSSGFVFFDDDKHFDPERDNTSSKVELKFSFPQGSNDWVFVFENVTDASVTGNMIASVVCTSKPGTIEDF